LGASGRAPAWWDMGGHAFRDCAKRRSRFSRTLKRFFPALGGSAVGAKEGVGLNFAFVELRAIDRIAAQFDEKAGYLNLGNDQPCDRSRGDPGRGFACGG